MRVVACNFCGSDQYEERWIEYLYSHQGKYLLVPNTPVEICRNCSSGN
jgi:YgiT-type zinc finger domain-containing protein